MSNTNHHNSQNWLLLGWLTIIWGTSYILIKKSLLGFSAVELACLRISISFLISIPFAVQALRSLPRNKYSTVLQVGFFGSGAPAFLFALSMTHSDSALNGVLNSLSPLWTLLIGYFLYQVAISKQKIGGVLIGFAGAVVLLLGKADVSLQTDVIYGILPVIATFCYGMSSNITKQKLQNQSPVQTTSLAMMMIGIPAFIMLLFTDVPQKISNGTVWFPLVCVAALSVFGTLIAWMLFYRLVQRTDALFAASVTYLIPIVAIAWGLFDGETFSAIQLVGVVLILVGVYFTTRQNSSALKKK